MNELVDNIKNLNEDEEFVLKIDAKEKAEREQRAHYEGSMRKARKEGLEQGHKQGLEQGLKEGKIDVAKNLKSMGLSIDQIVKATGLSKEEIESL